MVEERNVTKKYIGIIILIVIDLVIRNAYCLTEYKQMNGAIEVKYEEVANLKDKIYFKFTFIDSIPQDLLSNWDDIASRITVFKAMAKDGSPAIFYDGLECSNDKGEKYILCTNLSDGTNPKKQSYDLFTAKGIDPIFKDYTISLSLRFDEIQYSAGTDLKNAVSMSSGSGDLKIAEDGDNDESGTTGSNTSQDSSPCGSDATAAACDLDGDKIFGASDSCPLDAEIYQADGVTPVDGVKEGCPGSTKGATSSSAPPSDSAAPSTCSMIRGASYGWHATPLAFAGFFIFVLMARLAFSRPVRARVKISRQIGRMGKKNG